MGQALRDYFSATENWVQYSMTLAPYVMFNLHLDESEQNERLGQAFVWSDKIPDPAARSDVQESLRDLGRHNERIMYFRRLSGAGD